MEGKEGKETRVPKEGQEQIRAYYLWERYSIYMRNVARAVRQTKAALVMKDRRRTRTCISLGYRSITDGHGRHAVQLAARKSTPYS
jgi:hypothetical protein